MTWVWVMLGSALGGPGALLAFGPGGQAHRGIVPGRHADRQRRRLVRHRLLRQPDRTGWPRVRRHGRAPVRDDRRVRRLHHLFLIQLADANLARDSMALAGANAMLSLALCLIAVWLGHIAASVLNRLKGT